MKLWLGDVDRTDELLAREFALTPWEPEPAASVPMKHPKHLQWAFDALQRLTFGDSECIAARQAIEDERHAEKLRPKIIGRKIACGPCGGRPPGCEFCSNSGMFTITPEIAAEWTLDIIEGILEELEENRKEAARKRADIPF